ncbi:MAG: hypothetical protein AB7I13_01250 [Vicinamibacterales bacterium]
MHRVGVALIAFSVGFFAYKPPLAAQLPARHAISLTLGPSPYDLSGVGTAFAANAGFAWRPVGTGLVVEAGAGLFRYVDQGSSRVTWLFPELSVQGELPVGRAFPYLGGGVGYGRQSSAFGSSWEPTLHLVGGLRIQTGSSWGLRTEMRIRAVDPFGGNTVDFGAGLIRNLR